MFLTNIFANISLTNDKWPSEIISFHIVFKKQWESSYIEKGSISGFLKNIRNIKNDMESYHMEIHDQSLD